MKNNYLKILALPLFIICNLKTYSQTLSNSLINHDYYSFEVVDKTGWWMQSSNFEISNDKAFGNGIASLKYTSDGEFTGTRKAFGSSSIPEMLISLKPGDYELKFNVWLSGDSDYTDTKFDFREGSTTVQSEIVDYTGIEKQKWVQVSHIFTITNTINDARMLIMMNKYFGSNGTMYLDDVTISPTKVNLADYSYITTENNNHLQFEKGFYEVKLRLWIDEGTSIDEFYTQINEPHITNNWNISKLKRDKWIAMKRVIFLNGPVEDSEFRILVKKDSNYSGSFFIDDLTFIKITELEEHNLENTSDKLILQPNPATDYFEFNLPITDTTKIIIYNAFGTEIKRIVRTSLTDEYSKFDISFLDKGLYYIFVVSNKQKYIEKLIVQ